MKKKFLTMLILGTMVFMTACGKEKVEDKTTETNTKATTTEATEEVTEATTEATEEETTEAEDTEATEEAILEETTTEEAATSDNADYYSLATSYSKNEVESFVAKVKQQIVDKDWEALSENVAYPITIVGTTYNSSEEFLTADFDTLCTERFYTGVKEAETTNMFFNWKGVILGAGEVWIGEVLNDDSTSQGLKVTALNFDIQ